MPLAQQHKGRVFDELEDAYRVLSGEFRRLNLQKAANHQYLEAVVEHVGVALICLDDAGNVVMVNEPARALFGLPLLSTKSFARFDARLPGLAGAARRRRPRPAAACSVATTRCSWCCTARR